MQVRKSIFILSVYALLACGSFSHAGYIDNGDGTVTDTGTGLMWQQATALREHTWKQAISYCEHVSLAGYSDWRLPTFKELQSIVDYSIAQPGPTINTAYFSNTVASYYWSSTTCAYDTNHAWYVDFSYGIVYSNNKTYGYCVRAVRSGQSGSFDNLTLWPVPDTGQTKSYTNTFGEDHDYTINQPSYTKLAAGGIPLPDNATEWAMVRDEVTGLVWEEKHAMGDGANYSDSNDADNTYAWYDNNSATNGGGAGIPGDGTDTMDFIRTLNAANYGGFSDWRLPTVKELQSIVDYSMPYTTINITYFLNTVASGYWASTTFANLTNNAWYVNFNNGYVYYNFKTYYNYVRAVRSGQFGSFDTLIISKCNAGGGTVTSDDGKIDCGSHCIETYPPGTQVTLTAKAAFGATFAGWSGACSGRGSCEVITNGKLGVTATFSGRPCPITEALGENNPNLENLRAFRDSTLAQSALGGKVIQIYYNNADSINAALDSSPVLRAVARRVLEVIAPMVGRKE